LLFNSWLPALFIEDLGASYINAQSTSIMQREPLQKTAAQHECATADNNTSIYALHASDPMLLVDWNGMHLVDWNGMHLVD